MIRINVVMSLPLAFLVALVAQAEDGPKFKHVIPTNAVQFVRVFSTDSRVGAMLFDNLIIDTEIGRGTLPSVRTKQFSYVLQPVSDKEVCVVQLIRGFVNSQDTGTAALIIHAGGKTTAVDLSKAIEAAKDGSKRGNEELRKKAKKLASEQGFTVDNRPAKSNDFFVEIKTHVPAGKPLQTSLLLHVDRLTGDDGSGSLLTIDSIDFEVTPTAPVKP